MTYNWIQNILKDLRSFAASNNLPRLSAQLEHTLEIAKSEMSTKPRPTPNDDAPDRGQSATILQGPGGSQAPKRR